MKKIFTHILSLLTALVFVTSCDTQPVYKTDGIVIDIDMKQTGAGFCEVEFTPSDNAWYLADMRPAAKTIDPMENESEFMTIMLAQAKIKYEQWRTAMAMKYAPYIADFTSHSLKYKKSDDFFYFLEPDTDYWLFAFVVDPAKKKPCGDLFCKLIHTNAKSEIEVTLLYKISSSWDYGYPMNKLGKLSTDIPWIGMTFDSADIAQEMTSMTPKEFFRQHYDNCTEKNIVVHRGIYAHNNDNVGDGSSTTLYEEGHTYYTCMAVFDGDFDQHVIYKFTWDKNIEATFMPSDSLSDEW